MFSSAVESRAADAPRKPGLCVLRQHGIGAGGGQGLRKPWMVGRVTAFGSRARPSPGFGRPAGHFSWSYWGPEGPPLAWETGPAPHASMDKPRSPWPVQLLGPVTARAGLLGPRGGGQEVEVQAAPVPPVAPGPGVEQPGGAFQADGRADILALHTGALATCGRGASEMWLV